MSVWSGEAPVVVFWGTADLSTPRTRILLSALKKTGATVHEIRADIWTGERDKSQIKGIGAKLRIVFRWFSAYPGLVWHYLRAPRHDAVVVGYLGQLDVLVLWPFATARGVPVIWDMFISLYDTMVIDRSMFGKWHPVARFIFGWEWLAARAVRVLLMDTKAHARHMARMFGRPDDRVGDVPVCAEADMFPRAPEPVSRMTGTPIQVLFYGQFIPVHGLDAVVEAIRLGREKSIHWTIIGTGQEEARIERLIDEQGLRDFITRIPWVPYDTLHEHIASADVCLGIFSPGDKAANAIPNKAYQVLSVGRALVNRDSPAMRELVGDGMKGVKLVPAGDGAALLGAVLELEREGFPRPPASLRSRLSTEAAAEALARVLRTQIAQSTS